MAPTASPPPRDPRVPNDPNAPQHPASGDEEGLNELLADAERTVEKLRAELAERQRIRERKELTAAQHAEIDRLAEHLANAQVHWGQVRSFFEAALAELRDPEDRR